MNFMVRGGIDYPITCVKTFFGIIGIVVGFIHIFVNRTHLCKNVFISFLIISCFFHYNLLEFICKTNCKLLYSKFNQLGLLFLFEKHI